MDQVMLLNISSVHFQLSFHLELGGAVLQQ